MCYYHTCPECGANLDPGETCEECHPKQTKEKTADAPTPAA